LLYGEKNIYRILILSAQLVNMEDSSLGLQNVCCLGISRRDDACGEAKGIHTLHSFGFGDPCHK
jgi:hypothetical protein